MGDGDAAAEPDGGEVGRVFREESGRSLAALIRAFGDIDEETRSSYTEGWGAIIEILKDQLGLAR